MTNNEIRRMLLQHRDQVQRFILTDQEAQVLDQFGGHDMFCSADVTSAFGFSPSHTSMVMRRLFDKGYVNRRRVSAPSGGIEYEFTVGDRRDA